ncbi:2,3-dihydroxybiphenyl 1,2-dioxygenase, partial [Streptomyces sp. SID5464]|nr:2,3-dihydroxybiphenyl 1,2-dioxygenase [Streptomyces sp. SID5464]
MSEIRADGTNVRTAHQDLHSEQGALRGEHPGRSRNPVIKVADLAWLEFEKPDLDRAEVFARDFGFGIAARTERELWLRGTFAGSPCMVIRRGRTSRFIGPAFRAAERADLDRLARAT